MKIRAAKFVVAIIGSILSSANLSAAPYDAEQTADKCQTSPGDSAPAGSRWRYRIERGTGRHCWFLKGDSEKAARKTGEDTAATAEETAPAPPPRKKATAPRSVSDARAEFSQVPVEPEAAATPAERPAAPAPSIFDSIPRPTVPNAPAHAAATRATDPLSSAAPAPVAAAADQTAEAQSAPSATTAPSRTMPRAVPPVPQAEKPLSLAMLITIIAGGMSVAGVVVSMLFGWRASRSSRLTRAAPMPPLEMPDEPRRPARTTRRAAPARPPARDLDAA